MHASARAKRFLLLAATALGAVSAFRCDPGYDICTTVTRCSTGSPIVGAQVVFRYSSGHPICEEPSYSDPTGRACCSAMGISPPQYTVAVDKPGHRPGTVAVAEEQEDSALCLADQDACTAGAIRSCGCNDGGVGVEVCAADGTGYGPCQSCQAAADAAAE